MGPIQLKDIARAITVLTLAAVDSAAYSAPVYFSDREMFDIASGRVSDVLDFEEFSQGYQGQQFSTHGLSFESPIGLHVRDQSSYATAGYSGRYLSNNGGSSSPDLS